MTEDIFISEDKFISYTDEFKYLGSLIGDKLDDALDVENRIKQATMQFNSMKDNFFRNKDVAIEDRLRYYNALTVNVMLWGCKSWALKKSLIKKMEAFHHNCLRQIIRYNYYVHGPVSNEEIRKEAGNAYTIETTMELRRCRWLEKVANMEDKRPPKKLLAAWCFGKSRRRGKGKSTIRHGYSDTVKKLGFTSNELSEWLPAAKDRSLWGGIVEFRLNLAPGTYTKYKHRRSREFE